MSKEKKRMGDDDDDLKVSALVFDDDEDCPDYETEGVVEVKLYPSNVVNDRTVSTNERSAWSPRKLRALMHNFRNLDPKDRPYMVVEHSHNARDRLGRVENLTYSETDKWLYATGRLFKNKKAQFERAYVNTNDNSKKGVSLSYVVGQNYKGFLEFSFVKKPDFANAELVRYHSSSGLLATINCLGPVDVPAELNAARSKMMATDHQVSDDNVEDSAAGVDYSDKYLVDNGAYIVSTRDHFDGVRDHLLAKGVENPQITVANVDYINSMPEHKRNLFLAGLMTREGKRAEDATRSEDMQRRAAFEQRAGEARSLALSIAENNPLFKDDETKSKLGEAIMTNDVGKLIAQAAAQSLALRDKEIADRDAKIRALNEEVEKSKRKDAALLERSQIRSHAASTPIMDFQNFWKECAARAKENGIPAEPTPPQPSSLAKAFAAGAVIHQHSAQQKRSRPDIDTGREEAIALHKRSTWMGMSLHPHPDTSVKVVQHSADGCSRALVTDRTRVPSEMEHISGFYQDLVGGRRSHGNAKRNYDKALGAVCPAMQTALSYLVSGPTETNSQAGIFGHEDVIPKDFAEGIRHLLPYASDATRSSKYNHHRISVENMESDSAFMPGRAY